MAKGMSVSAGLTGLIGVVAFCTVGFTEIFFVIMFDLLLR